MTIEGQFEHTAGKSKLSLAEASVITEAARQAGLVLNTSCAGRGNCGGCVVELLAGTYRQDGSTFAVTAGERRRVHGCRTTIVEGPFQIFVPRRSLVETGEKVVADFVLNGRHRHEPTVRTMKVQLPKPVLREPLGDYERLARLMRNDLGVQLAGASLTALRELPRLTRAEIYDLTVRIGWRHHQGWELVAISNGGQTPRSYGLAIDIGTTTVAAALVDIEAAKIVDTSTCYNQQIRQADDVAARIASAGADHGLEELNRLIVEETINPMIQLLCRKQGIGTQDVHRAVISGNTVMWHLFLGIDPTGLGRMPFPPGANDPGAFRARDVGLTIDPAALVDVVPSISAYVGGDIVSDIYVTQLHEAAAPQMVIDVGTNGEIALIADGRMFVTACAAGPAFEGLRISCGMRASTGAIETITIDRSSGECRCGVIGNSPPVGMCGSALIDFVAEGLRAGLITEAGRYNREMLGRCPRLREQPDSKVLEYLVAPQSETDGLDHDIAVSEKDLETLLQAKGAVYSAIRILCRRAGIEASQLEKVFLAGGFARYINVANAMTIGLLPELPAARYLVVGNGSLAGAFVALIDRTSWQAFRDVLRKPEVVELNLEPDFQDEYTFALFLPNFQKELFPQTSQSLGG